MVKLSARYKGELYRPPRRVRIKDWEGVLVVHRGMSAIVHGYLLDLDVDEENRTATVRVKLADPTREVPALNDAQVVDLKQAATVLAKRAQRFYGRAWTVVNWTGFHTMRSNRVAGGQQEYGSGM